MIGALPAALATAGIQMGGSLLAGLFGGKPELEDLQWGKESALFASFMTRELAKKRREAMPALRLEAQRAGTAMGGAYLSGVTEIEKQMDEIFGREVSRFEIEQTVARRGWREKQAMVRYQGERERGIQWQQRIEQMAGIAAAVPMQMYGIGQQEKFRGEITETMRGMQPQVPAIGQLQQMNRLLMELIKSQGGYGEKVKGMMDELYKGIVERPAGPYAREMIGAGY